MDCRPRSPFVQRIFEKSPTVTKSSESSGSSTAKICPLLEDRSSIGLFPLRGFGANAPVIIPSIDVTPSSTKPSGRAEDTDKKAPNNRHLVNDNKNVIAVDKAEAEANDGVLQ